MHDLFTAIEKYDVAAVTRILDTGVSPDTSVPNGDTLLIMATVNRCDGIVNELLKRKANPNLTDGQGDTALLYATAQGRIGIMQMLIEHKADIHFVGNGLDTPFRIAISNEDEAALELLLKAGCCASDKNAQGTPALVLAAAMYPKSLAVLLRDKPDLYMGGAKGTSPLRAAISGENEESIALLLDAGYDPSFADDQKMSDLGYAVRVAPENIAHMIRASMKKFELINELKRNDPVQDILPLIHQGVDLGLRDHTGSTALYYAIANYIYNERSFEPWLDVIDKLIENGADLNQKMNVSPRGVQSAACATPMFWLAFQFSEIFADKLIAKGGSVFVTDAQGQYPWDVAREWKNPQMADHLEMRGTEEISRLTAATKGTEQTMTKVKSISFKRKV